MSAWFTFRDAAAAISLVENVAGREAQDKFLADVIAAARTIPWGTKPSIGSSPVYGCGGYNRYFLYRTPEPGKFELRLSRRHCLDDIEAQRALSLGLTVS